MRVWHFIALISLAISLLGSVAFAGSWGIGCRYIENGMVQTSQDPFLRLCLRGGTDWSDDSAGVVRARLRMKKPEPNVTETANATTAKDSKEDSDRTG
jgi:hypothetical protein